MIDRVMSYVLDNHMIEKGDYVVAGVSGGADSVCLLLMLEQLRTQIPFELRVVHVEHGIRGQESVEDAQFVDKLCAAHGIPCEIYRKDIPEYAKELGMSIEEAARVYRYEVFTEAVSGHSHGKIAVAHNQNDNAETMLHNMVRGSAIKGMAGIAPVRGQVIRPLLCLSRSEIETYLKGQGQEYRTDCTNMDVVYTRNKIRHEVLPALCEINTQAVEHMAGTAQMLRETYEYMQEQALQAQMHCVVWNEAGYQNAHDGEGIRIQITAFREYPLVIRKQILHNLVTDLAGSSRDVTEAHICSIEELCDKQTGRSVMLPYGLMARREYDEICITKGTGQLDGNRSDNSGEMLPRELKDHPEFTCRLLENTVNTRDFPKKKYTKWFDYDKIGNILCVRTRQTGDFLTLDDETNRTQKLKKYFVNEKIPASERNQILLLADGSHILWIVGYRISAYYKVTGNTKRILEVQYNGGNEENE